MKDYISIGTAPIDEDCVQVDSSDPSYIPKMKEECKRYKEFLEKKLPIPEELKGRVYLSIKRFEHDFGPYFEVVANYDDNDELAENYAVYICDNQPLTWND